MEELKYWLALNKAPGVGPKRFQVLLDSFGSVTAAWRAERAQLLQVKNFGDSRVDEFLAYRQQADPDKEVRLLERLRVRALTLRDPEYPESLSRIFDPPPVLYIKGEFLPQDSIALAVVGTRNPTHYGRAVAEKLSGELAAKGITIVSGMARGIDTVSHQGALRAGGRTVAVLGCGLDIVYPLENARLMGEIAAAGAVISPYPFGTPPEPGNFPARNRIISGLSLGTIVVEAQDRSGALITADFALEQGREVFAIPGSITSPNSNGANRLIQQGAKLVGSVNDILEEFPRFFGPVSDSGREVSATVTLPDLTEDEKTVLGQIHHEPVHIDQITENCPLTGEVVAANLVYLELKGHVQRLPGQLFARLGRTGR